MSIVFQQYIAPNGRIRAIEVDRPAEIERLAEAIVRSGYCLDVEILNTGEVSYTVSAEDDCIASVLSPNGREVDSAVDELVRKAARFLKLEVA